MLSLKKKIRFWLNGFTVLSLAAVMLGTIAILKNSHGNYQLLYGLYIGLFFGLLLGSYFLSIYFSKKLTTPVKQLTRYIAHLGKSNFEYRPIQIRNQAPEVMNLYEEFGRLIELMKVRDEERKMAENTLRYNELKYREMADLLPQGVFETTEEGVITYVNKAWLNFFDYSKQEILSGVKLNNIFQSDDISRILSNENLQNFECSFMKKNGSGVPVVLYTSRIIKNKKSFGYRFLIIDNSERKRHLEELEKARFKAEESDRLKSAFLANMSHEIRTPMNAILGFSNLLHIKEVDTKTRDEYLNYIKSSGEHLLKLIDDIIDIAKIEAGELRIIQSECNISFLMTELKSIFQNSKSLSDKNIEIVFNKEVEIEPLIILTDPYRLRQIFMNLIGNAIKFTNQGYIELGYHKFHNRLQFYVKDTGIGIPEHMHEIIFERFRQAENTRAGGTGLGLSITQSIIHLLGGRIWVHSEEGKGSTFYFTIPFIRQTAKKKYISKTDNALLSKILT
jgi:PAS domain S-box-containing protein